jgi:tRNA(fMet)-specific endonuclease VapC
VALRYLLDTNIISESMRPAPHRRLLYRLREHVGECATASTVWHELLFGCRRLPPSRRREKIESYLFDTLAPTMPILPYDEVAAGIHADTRGRAALRGHVVPHADGQIGSIAVANGLALVTANAGDYSEFAGLQIENWLA